MTFPVNLLSAQASAPTGSPGADASTANNKQLLSELSVDNLLLNGTATNPATSRPVAQSRIAVLAAPFATTTAVDTVDNTKIILSTATALDTDPVHGNLSTSALAVPNGVASLDSATPPKVTLSQCPNLGVGFLKGPYGAATQASADVVAVASTGPYQQVAQIPLGALGTGVTFKPYSFATMLFIQADYASRGVVEIRIGDNNQTIAMSTTDATALAAARTAQRVVGYGYGRAAYLDYQSVSARPAGSAAGITPSSWTSYGPSANLTLTLWLVAETGTVTMKQNQLVVFSAFLFRTAS